MVLRHSQPQQSEIIALSSIVKSIFPGAFFNHQKSIWEFETGETLKLDHFDRPEKYQDFIGKSFAWIGWEELTTWKDDVCYKLMMSCLRTINPRIRLHVRSTTNASGPGHGWVKRRFRLNGSSFAGKVVGLAITDSRDEAGNLEQPRRAVLSKVSENLLLLLKAIPVTSIVSCPMRRAPRSDSRGAKDRGTCLKAASSTTSGSTHASMWWYLI